MVVLVVILALGLALGVLAFDAWILSMAVPALLSDPTNFWGWFGVVATVSLTLTGAMNAKSIS